MDRYPWQLSGGMQQRVAIARALAYQPSILLMDEPFASVDAQTRGDLEDLVLRVRDEFGITILFVTHDIDESVYLSDGSSCSLTRRRGSRGDPGRVAATARPDRDEGAARSSRACARTCYRLIKREQGRSRRSSPSHYPEPRFEKSITGRQNRRAGHLHDQGRTGDESDEDAPDACTGGRRGRRRRAHCGGPASSAPEKHKRALATINLDGLPIATASRSTSGSPRASSRSTGSRSRRPFSKVATTSCWRWPTTRATSATSAGCRQSSPAPVGSGRDRLGE